MNSSNINTPVKGKRKKKGFKGTPKSNKKDHKKSKQIGTQINDKIEAQFSFKEKLIYSGSNESANFPTGFKTPMFVFSIQFSRFFSFSDFIHLLSKTTFNKVLMIIKWQV